MVDELTTNEILHYMILINPVVPDEAHYITFGTRDYLFSRKSMELHG